jgi:branched-chain amino acid transport system ATP-binding protein
VSELLEVESLSSGYGDIRVVHEVSFSVDAGQAVALLGRNGAGKTTVLRAISGLNPATRGRVVLEGRDLSKVTVHHRVGTGIAYVQEGKRVFRHLSVRDNLALGGYAVRLSRRMLDERIETAYGRFPVLADRRNVPAAALSGGQQQMLAIAQALISEPRVLLLDEPSGGLAPTIVADVLATVKELIATGLAVVLVEQSVGFALDLADKVVVMDLGQVVLDASATAPDLEKQIEKAYFAAALSGVAD